MKIINRITTVSLLFAGLTATAQPVQKPNIIYILCDDLGYGDVQCLNPERGKIATPNMDKLASQGMTFTNTHSSSSVCTPTRYGIMTGRYNWRTHLQSGVLNGYSEPLIDAARLTVPALLRQNGYTTGMIGKWHLGMDIPKDVPSPTITNGPIARGFDTYFGISASLDMPPFAFIENDHFTEPLTTTKKFQRTGPAAASFEAMDVLPTVTKKAVDYIHTQSKTGKPFFLYLPLNSPHTPILPTKEWQGKSGISPYGDFVMQTDWTIGQILDAIDAAGILSNTLVILTSDNGCSKAANIPQLQSKGHFPSAWFRGSKADLWDGGHRIPFIVQWPATVAAGSTCDQLVCLTDLMATCADLVGTKLPDNAGEDSFSFLQALKGKQIVSTRAGVIHHSIPGYFSYRQGKWKLLLSKGSGGWSSPTEKEMAVGSDEAQLYDMEKDPGETNNLYKTQPEIVAQLLKQLESDVQRGRSTAGADQKNDVDKIVLWKNKK